MDPKETLLEATRRAVRAAAIGDLAALESALSERRAALPLAPVAERLAAFQEGETIPFLLGGLKRQLRDQYRRLEQVKTGLKRTASPIAATIDVRA